MECIYCNTQQPNKGFFCPSCAKQTKCKTCNEELIKDAKVCVYCAEAVGQKENISNINTIEFSETETERNFKATFTDTVGQSISESFGMILSSKIGSKKNLPSSLPSSIIENKKTDTIDTEAEVLADSEVDSTLENSIESNDLPTLRDVKLRDLAKNETDWLLVYAFNASKNGTKEFTRENIAQLYRDTDRYTLNRQKAFSRSIKQIIKSLYIKSTNDTNFILLEKGKKKAIEILNGNSNSKASSTFVNKNTHKEKGSDVSESKDKKTKSSNSIGFVDLKLPQAEQKALKDFFLAKKPKSQNEKVITAMKWFLDHKKLDEISVEEINYLLSLASEAPTALPQVLGNMIGASYRWVTKGSKGKYQLSSIGESHILNNLPK
jgi:hypothetical protein